jgi:hypothetical protein
MEQRVQSRAPRRQKPKYNQSELTDEQIDRILIDLDKDLP